MNAMTSLVARSLGTANPFKIAWARRLVSKPESELNCAQVVESAITSEPRARASIHARKFAQSAPERMDCIGHACNGGCAGGHYPA